MSNLTENQEVVNAYCLYMPEIKTWSDLNAFCEKHDLRKGVSVSGFEKDLGGNVFTYIGGLHFACLPNWEGDIHKQSGRTYSEYQLLDEDTYFEKEAAIFNESEQSYIARYCKAEKRIIYEDKK